MQEIFRSNFTSKRKRPRISAPICGILPIPVPAEWGPLFPKSMRSRVCRPWTRRRAFASLSQRALPREDGSCFPSVFAWPAERHDKTRSLAFARKIATKNHLQARRRAFASASPRGRLAGPANGAGHAPPPQNRPPNGLSNYHRSRVCHDAELSRALPRGEGPMAPRTGPAMHHHHRIAR